jgi:hypothetical protein
VDNISANGGMHRDFYLSKNEEKRNGSLVNPLLTANLFHLGSYLKRQRIAFQFNPQRFPGLNFKLNNTTFIVFTSGTFNALGSKTVHELGINIEVFKKHFARCFPSLTTFVSNLNQSSGEGLHDPSSIYLAP